ncbi:MAG: type II toxin-antitoxin system HicB family antitoxin [Acinetobacter populi]|jgi:predicted HicB family RNase H-like nuclease|uniref:toxin-antitoxin system HicB family antitoxin n=1 Tax=Acinetobacter populi TaxID=1582270 RepID=UPI0023521121|nr:toxin-antitoxin system HicB family antitoxin [Acinetobacter populi]MCH4246475.1 type II toxin-antitoxin system HicB family antitoxin [Acinetobacter populi]
MSKGKVVDVKVRLDIELHKKLKAKAQLEERSMNYLVNKAVELLVSQSKEVRT